jgi:hypothetical protein
MVELESINEAREKLRSRREACFGVEYAAKFVSLQSYQHTH